MELDDFSLDFKTLFLRLEVGMRSKQGISQRGKKCNIVCRRFQAPLL